MQDMEYVDYTLCKLQTRPSEEQDCSNENCVREPHYRYESSKYIEELFYAFFHKNNQKDFTVDMINRSKKHQRKIFFL